MSRVLLLFLVMGFALLHGSLARAQVLRPGAACVPARPDDGDCDGRDDDCDGALDEDCTASAVLELGIVADASVRERYDTDEEALTAIEAVMSRTSAIFERDAGIALRVSYAEILPMTSIAGDLSADRDERYVTWLDYYRQHPVLSTMDAALLVSHGGPSGLYVPDGACARANAVAMISVPSSTTMFARYLAKLFGVKLDHIAGCAPGYIMHRVWSGSEQFSPCSIAALTEARERKACLHSFVPEAPDCDEGGCAQLDLSVVATQAYRAEFSSDQAAHAAMLEAVARASAILERDARVRVNVVYSEIAPSGAPLQEKPGIGNNQLFGLLKVYRAGKSALSSTDATVLFTSAQRPQPGAAVKGGVCGDLGLVLTRRAESAGFTARHLSWLLGATHDSDAGCTEGFVMGKGAELNDYLSSCTHEAIEETVAAKACL